MKIFIRALLIAVGLFLFADAIILSAVSNFNAGVIFEGALGALTLLWGIFFDRLQAMRGIWRALKWTAAAGLAAVFGICVFLGAYGSADTVNFDEDALIVLGCGVNGTVPTEPLSARLNKAVEYEEKNPSALIVVTGGQGPQEDISEAECMAQYLIQAGINEEKIIKEDLSTSTSENLRYTKEKLDAELKDYTSVIITNDFHIFRAKRLAAINGLDVSTMHADTPFLSAAMMYLREILALGKFIVFKE